MTDLNRAVNLLKKEHHALVLCRGTLTETSNQRGIRSLLDALDSRRDYRGYAAADKIVGKAAAQLYLCLGVSAVFAEVMTETAKKLLTENGVEVNAEKMVPVIINRQGDGICPMEQTVADVEDIRLAYRLLHEKADALRAAAGNH